MRGRIHVTFLRVIEGHAERVGHDAGLHVGDPEETGEDREARRVRRGIAERAKGVRPEVPHRAVRRGPRRSRSSDGRPGLPERAGHAARRALLEDEEVIVADDLPGARVALDQRAVGDGVRGHADAVVRRRDPAAGAGIALIRVLVQGDLDVGLRRGDDVEGDAVRPSARRRPPAEVGVQVRRLRDARVRGGRGDARRAHVDVPRVVGGEDLATADEGAGAGHHAADDAGRGTRGHGGDRGAVAAREQSGAAAGAPAAATPAAATTRATPAAPAAATATPAAATPACATPAATARAGVVPAAGATAPAVTAAGATAPAVTAARTAPGARVGACPATATSPLPAATSTTPRAAVDVRRSAARRGGRRGRRRGGIGGVALRGASSEAQGAQGDGGEGRERSHGAPYQRASCQPRRCTIVRVFRCRIGARTPLRAVSPGTGGGVSVSVANTQ